MKQLAYIDVPGPWNTGVKSVPIKSKYSYERPPLDPYGADITGTRYSSVKAFTQKGTADRVDGWREPTLFRGYVARVFPSSGTFDYKCMIAGHGGRHTGNHYLSNSQVLWAGMQGSGRYPIDIGADNIAKQKVLSSLDKAELQLGVMIAEMVVTMRMLTGHLTALRKHMSAAKRFLEKLLKGGSNYRPHLYQKVLRLRATKSGVKKLTKILGKAAANRWLEYQYGWKPLMSDIYATCSLLDEQAKRRKIITGKGTHRSGTDPTYTFPQINAGLMYVNPKVISGAYCRADWVIHNSVAAQLNRLGLTNILEIGWELIPFSFVIDWVAPIGDYLGALGAGWGLTFKGGSITRYTTADVTCIWTAYPFIKGTPIRYRMKSVTWFRYPISEATLTTRVYTKNPFSVTRAVTALALLTQLLSKKG